MKRVNVLFRFTLASALLVGSSLTLLSLTTRHSKPESTYQVTFVNRYWNNLHLQVRVGNNSAPERNNVAYDGNLSRGQSVTVSYDVLCWYRRDANPDQHDNIHFTNWTSTGCFSGSPCAVDNP